MRIPGSFLCVFGLMVAAPALADDVQALATKSGCMACHGIDKKVVGPGFKDVAAKYHGDAEARARLIEKVKAGGKGVWGPVPMPANSPRVSDENIEALVDWVLSMHE